MSVSGKAVFLSYAREDADAARRIADALRTAGIDVWFDESELRGGDEWDLNIRRQIKECALFIPVISSHTQTRREGYFRREWNLAAQRLLDMAPGQPFLVPVVIDGTNEREALVADEFRRVQWTPLRQAQGGDLDEKVVFAFCARVRKLLGLEKGTGATPMRTDGAPIGSHVRDARTTANEGGRRWIWAVAIVIGIGVAGLFALRPTAKPVAATANSHLPTPNSELPAAAFPADKSIAVLPFTNLSDDRENTDFFSDGIHEDILTNLANIRELRVVSRTSVMEYRGTTKKIPQIARELGVAYLLEGSVRRSGNQLRITGQLIRAATDEHLWAKSYDRELAPKEMFAIQAALATDIASALQATLSPETKRLLERRPTENLAAYDLYLRARKIALNVLADLTRRGNLLQQAVNLDPNFAEAWGELAVTHASHVLQDFDHSPARLAQADAAIGQAIRLAPEAPEIIRLLGAYAYRGYRDYARATAQFEKVIGLQPNNSDAFYNLALVQRRQGRWVEAIANLRKATQLDPGNVFAATQAALTLMAGRRWDEAVAIHDRLVQLAPGRPQERSRLAFIAFAATGSTGKADAWLSQLSPTELESPPIRNERKYWAGIKGNYAEWKRLDDLQPYFDADGTPHWAQAINAATMLAAHGDKAAAQARLGDFPAEVRAALERDPANAVLWRGLSVIEALTGDREAALRDARKAIDVLPEARDALFGPLGVRNLAIVYAWTGDKDRAFAECARFLRVPYSREGSVDSVHTLRVDPAFAPLRGDPRFEALLKDPKNNAPLF